MRRGQDARWAAAGRVWCVWCMWPRACCQKRSRALFAPCTLLPLLMPSLSTAPLVPRSARCRAPHEACFSVLQALGQTFWRALVGFRAYKSMPASQIVALPPKLCVPSSCTRRLAEADAILCGPLQARAKSPSHSSAGTGQERKPPTRGTANKLCATPGASRTPERHSPMRAPTAGRDTHVQYGFA